jgi:hypothetical protein
LWFDEDSSIDAGATHPVALIKSVSLSASMFFYGTDFSANANTYFPDGASWYIATLVNCRLNTTATIQATLSNDAAGEVYGYDCTSNSASNLGFPFFHYNYRGNTVAQNTAYITADGASYDATGDRYSLTCTSVNGTYDKPYFTPWMAVYNAALTAVTPWLEIARDGSATAYNDDQVWSEWVVKTTASSCIGTLYTDRKALLQTAQAQAAGVGTSAWTGLSGTANSMKCDSGAAVTPAVAGNVLSRLALTGTAAVYLDPYMRGLSAAPSLMRVNGAGFMNGFAAGTSGLTAIGHAS